MLLHVNKVNTYLTFACQNSASSAFSRGMGGAGGLLCGMLVVDGGKT